MGLIAIAELAFKVISYANAAAKAGKDIVEFTGTAREVFQKMRDEGRGPTAEETAYVDNMIAELRAELHAPDEGDVSK